MDFKFRFEEEWLFITKSIYIFISSVLYRIKLVEKSKELNYYVANFRFFAKEHDTKPQILIYSCKVFIKQIRKSLIYYQMFFLLQISLDVYYDPVSPEAIWFFNHELLPLMNEVSREIDLALVPCIDSVVCSFWYTQELFLNQFLINFRIKTAQKVTRHVFHPETVILGI